MYIFTDRRGRRRWITAEGLLRYFGVCICDARRYFYSYDIYARCYRW